MISALFTSILLCAIATSTTACLAELRIWAPKVEGNRFLNLDVTTSSTYDHSLLDAEGMREYQDEGSETQTHICIGLVYYQRDQDILLVVNNTNMVVNLATMETTYDNTSSTCMVHNAGSQELPCWVSGAQDRPERLNWWLGNGTDLDTKPLFKGVDITCSGDEDLRAL